MAWAIKRGANEASTAVVVRVINDATTPWMAVGGIDPFTTQEKGLVLARPVDVRLDVRIPRTQFGDTPRTEWMFYPSERAAKAGSPSIIVYYLGVPDTTPEFTDEAKLDAYLDDRLVRARAARGRAP